MNLTRETVLPASTPRLKKRPKDAWDRNLAFNTNAIRCGMTTVRLWRGLAVVTPKTRNMEARNLFRSDMLREERKQAETQHIFASNIE